jgi:predicted AAA+ superfamily ATPase
MIPMKLSRLVAVPDHSFFLFGARGTGKSTWLREKLPAARHFDLLETALQLELTADPGRLEALVGDADPGDWVVLDEVQKIPRLLGEVHRLMETKGWRFALCGSSARQLKRGGADLLAGRALTLTMEAFSFAELGNRFDLEAAIEWGLMPVVHGKGALAPEILSAYVGTYLREEIKEEGAVRRFAPFARFLAVAGMLNGQVLNAQNIATEAQVPRSTVEGYFELLVDTLLGFPLPSYRPGLKVREVARPKFYWLDPGVARACAGLLRDALASDWRGTALETLIYHELRVWNNVAGKHRSISYYQTGGGAEIDFVIETRKRQTGTKAQVVCIEVKHAARWKRQWERAMRDMASSGGIEVARQIGVYRGTRRYRFGDVEVLPVEDFLQELHAGGIF